MAATSNPKTFLEKYKDCDGCPVHQYCGTMISSVRLCHSYKEEEEKKQS